MAAAAYTARMVEKLLRNYLDILCTLNGNSQNLHDSYVITHVKREQHRIPFGQTKNGPDWPFMETQHAKPPMDGKTKSRFFEELHCAVLDIEEAFSLLDTEDQKLILDYHITQKCTLDELMVQRNVTSRGSMHQRVFRAVQRLTYLIEAKKV